jgi:hypothetical protein
MHFADHRAEVGFEQIDSFVDIIAPLVLLDDSRMRRRLRLRAGRRLKAFATL